MSETSTTSTKCDAVVLLSGGLDSAVVLSLARRRGLECTCLSIDYGQRHRHELDQARKIATGLGAVEHIVLNLDMRAIGASALTSDIAVPKQGASHVASSPGASEIPITYVPARNLIFLSLAAGLAESRGCREVHIGVNAVDYSGYPDCRPEFINAFAEACNLATRAGVEQHGGPWMRIVTPLIGMRKAEIIRAGHDAGLDFSLTHSCYDPVVLSAARGSEGQSEGEWGACGECDSCRIRAKGFIDAGLADPTVYVPGLRPEFRG